VLLLLAGGASPRVEPAAASAHSIHLPVALHLPDPNPSSVFVPATLRHPKLTTLLAEVAESTPQTAAPNLRGLLRPPAPKASQERTPVTLPKAVQDALRSRLMRMDPMGAIQVYIELTSVTPQNLQQLKAAGVTFEIIDAKHKQIQARVPPGSLDQLESMPFVRFVRLPNYAVYDTGSVDTQGDTILQAQQARSELHIDGTGVRVGVISDGLKGVFATGCTTCQGAAGGPLSTGDLPQSTGTRNSSGVLTASSGGITGRSFHSNGDLEGLPSGSCGFAGAGAEGTALLEIVHDIAPGAQLFFDNSSTDMEFNQAVNDLASKADVVMDDINFFGLPYDGASAVSQNTASALNSATDPMRAYFTAVGNNARQHYLGLYTDSGVNGTTLGLPPGDLHLFQASSTTSDILGLGPTATDRIILPESGEVVVILSWNDPFGGSTNNYDLYLINESTGKVASSSTDVQNGAQDPVEFFDYTNDTGAQGNFDIIIQNVNNQAQPKQLSLFLFEPECAAAGPLPIATGHTEIHNYNTVGSSIAAEADAGGSPVSVVSVGAIRASDSGNKDIEYYSSNGPTLDGRVKPDVTGIDGVSITGAGDFENPFYGTSAATPHAAGIAALLLQAAPCLLANSTGARDDTDARSTLRSLVLGNSIPLGSPVPNNIFGYGRLDAVAAAALTVPTAVGSGQPTLMVSGNSPTGFTGSLPASGFTDAQQCPVSVTATGGCSTSSGSSATVNCPFGPSAVTLTATADGVSFSAPQKATVIVTNFTMAASPAGATVTAGQSAKYQIVITPKFGAFSTAISLACSGLPARATCSFTPTSVTPGAQPASSQLSITTAAASGMTPLFHVVPPPVSFRPRWLPGVALFAFLLFGLISLWQGERIRRLTTYFALALLLTYLAALLACGNGGSNDATASVPGTPSGTYSVTVTATSGSLVATSPVTLTVQ
jgi:Subtilase family